jgi:UDP-GlcNAc:undecaprenyl-phosphate GlcNAc-1-phosphate transferase
MTYLVAFPVALLASLVFTPVTRALAVRYSLLDIPDGERFHSSPIPLLGGVAVMAAVLVSGLTTYFLLGLKLEAAHVFLGTGLVLSFALGMYDDRRGMGARWKICGQAACAVLLVIGCYVGGWIEGGYLFPILVVWIIGIMNAINFLDNMDGIAGGVIALASLAFLVSLFSQQHWAGTILAGALCGASVGFLRFNFPPASIFLGDAGSLPMGYLLGALSIMAAGQAVPGSLLTPIIILGYPLFDITFVTIVRVREKRQFYLGGKDHSSHRFASLLTSPRKTALVVYFVCVVLGLLAVLVERAQHLALSVSVVAVLLLVFLLLGVRLVKVSTDALT